MPRLLGHGNHSPVRPGRPRPARHRKLSTWRKVLLGVVTVVGLAVAVAPFASAFATGCLATLPVCAAEVAEMATGGASGGSLKFSSGRLHHPPRADSPACSRARGRPRHRPRRLFADRGYDYDKYRRLLRARSITQARSDSSSSFTASRVNLPRPSLSTASLPREVIANSITSTARMLQDGDCRRVDLRHIVAVAASCRAAAAPWAMGSPCPKTAVSTSSLAIRCSDSMARVRSVLKTPSMVRPTLATASPVNSTPGPGRWSAIDPSVCPGTATTTAPPPNSSTSPSCTSRSTRHGGAGGRGGSVAQIGTSNSSSTGGDPAASPGSPAPPADAPAPPPRAGPPVRRPSPNDPRASASERSAAARRRALPRSSPRSPPPRCRSGSARRRPATDRPPPPGSGTCADSAVPRSHPCPSLHGRPRDHAVVR